MTPHHLCDLLIRIGTQVRACVHNSLVQQTHEERSSIVEESADDTIYQIDRHVEAFIVPTLEEQSERLGGIILIAEGISEQGMTLPHGWSEDEAKWRIIIDPIDGTRGIMYDKRSAFFLAGAAPNRGAETSLQHIEIAVMVELPTTRSYLSDILWAIRGQGAKRISQNLLNGDETEHPITPSKASTIYGGFAQIARFFPPGREILAAIDEELCATLFPDAPMGRAFLFEDQYISTGGQLYELLLGHDASQIFAIRCQTSHPRGELRFDLPPYDICSG